MPLVKAQCTNCGANLEVDESKDAAICPFCNTPYIVEKAINQFHINSANLNIQNANINVSGTLDADTMFENWIVTKDARLKEDFRYYYATDERCKYVTSNIFSYKLPSQCTMEELYIHISETREYIELAKNICTGPRFSKYLNKELDSLQTELKRYTDFLEENELEEKKAKEATIVAIIVAAILGIGVFIFLNINTDYSVIISLLLSSAAILLVIFIYLRFS